MNQNPATVRVYYDEDVERENEDEIREELANDLQFVDGVVYASVEIVYTGRPYEALIEVEYDEAEVSRDTVLYNISALEYLHNANFSSE